MALVLSIAGAFIAACIGAPPAPVGPGACEPSWRSLGGLPGLNAPANAAALFDPDGPGPAPAYLVLAGDFTIASGTNAARIARFDGERCFAFGPGFNAAVNAIAVFDPDGPGPLPPLLAAGGRFTHSGNVEISRVGLWNGQSWSTLGDGVDGEVHALASWDPDGAGPLPPLLIAAGNFLFAGGVSANGIAAWDGQSWSPLGEGLNSTAFALATWDPDGDGPLPPLLIAGGAFTAAGGVAVNHVASWDGEQWRPLGQGVDGAVLALTTWYSDGSGAQPASLVAGGAFISASGTPARHIARWDGAQWSAVDGGVNGQVRALASWESGGAMPVLVAGGSFSAAGGEAAAGIARFDGGQWLPLRAGVAGVVNALASWSGGTNSQRHELFVGGSFNAADDVSTNYAARFRDELWRAFGESISGPLHALTPWDPDGPGAGPLELVVGGSFGVAGGRPARNIASWNGSSWRTFGAGTSAAVRALTLWDPDGPGPAHAQVVAGGDFAEAGGALVGGIARWDGGEWRPFHLGFNGSVFALTVWDQDGDGPLPGVLIAGGIFLDAFPDPVNFIARWDGVRWTPLGAGFDSVVYALDSFDPDGPGPLPPQLIAAGGFTSSGPTPVNAIARWDGTQWQPLGPGFNGNVLSLTTWDPDGAGPAPPQLVAGGGFTHAGGTPASSIARWDGAEWHAIGAGLPRNVRTIAALSPDSSGPPQLFAAGEFVLVRGTIGNRVAKWDGQEWLPVAHGVSHQVNAIKPWRPPGAAGRPPDLFAGGNFIAISGVPSSHLAWWGCPLPSPCPADFNGDGQVDFFDYLDFVQAFAADDPAADFNGDGQVDFFDYLDFVAEFAAGCD